MERHPVRFITKSNLPFQIRAHKGPTDLVSMVWLAVSKTTFFTPQTARRRLRKVVQGQRRILPGFSSDAKLLIALDY
jgi:hypothetical protein